MSNFLHKELTEVLLPQIDIMVPQVEVIDEIEELDRKYGDTIVGYRGEPFYIDSFETNWSNRDKVILRGNLLDENNVWNPVRIPLSDTDLDFDYVGCKYVNTPDGVLYLLRSNTKQYRWGIHTSNAHYKFPTGLPRKDDPRFGPSLRRSITYAYRPIFNPGYKSKEELIDISLSQLRGGIALNPAYFLCRKDSRSWLVYKEKVVAQTNRKLSDITIQGGYSFLENPIKELLRL